MERYIEKLKAYHNKIVSYELANHIADLIAPSVDAVTRAMIRGESSLLQTRDDQEDDMDDEEGREHVLLNNS